MIATVSRTEISGYQVTLFAPELRGTHAVFFRAEVERLQGREIDVSLKAEAVTGRFGPQSQWVNCIADLCVAPG